MWQHISATSYRVSVTRAVFDYAKTFSTVIYDLTPLNPSGIIFLSLYIGNCVCDLLDFQSKVPRFDFQAEGQVVSITLEILTLLLMIVSLSSLMERDRKPLLVELIHRPSDRKPASWSTLSVIIVTLVIHVRNNVLQMLFVSTRPIWHVISSLRWPVPNFYYSNWAVE